jgi:predicted PurR-regulated permease PerM
MAREATTAPDPAAKRFFLVLLVATLVVLGLILFRLGPALVLAAVLAVLLMPLQRKLERRFRRRTIASSMLVVGTAVLILGPVISLSAYAVKEISSGIRFVGGTLRSEGVAGLIDRLPDTARRLVEQALSFLPTTGPDALGTAVQQQTGKAAAAVGSMVATTGSVAIQSAMMLVALFFFLSQGRELLDWVDEASPLRRGQTHELLAEFKKVANSIVVSTFITSGVQAVAAFIGYLIARVPNAIFFAAITFIFAFIPSIGAGVVCVGAAGLLFLTGHPYMAIFLAVWGVLVVGLVDNVVKPILMKGKVQMNGAVVFFSLIGGLLAFGPIGLLVGPFAVALLLALLRMYQRDFSPKRVAAS